jgi:hypothetical protein
MGYSTRDRGNYRTPALRPVVCRLPSNKPPSLRDDGRQRRDFHMVCWQSSRATSRIILACSRVLPEVAHYCGGIGARDDGNGTGLRPGTAGTCRGAVGILPRSSRSAACSFSISRAIWS